MTLSRDAVEAVGGSWATCIELNNSLDRIRGRRLSEINLTDDSGCPLTGAKVLRLLQTVLYRVVNLAEGCATAWNTSNVLASLLCCRAIIESVALVSDFETKLVRLTKVEDRVAIIELVHSRTFAEKQTKERSPDFPSVNVMTLISSLEKKVNGVEGHYAFLCEMCHPNYFGTAGLFSVIDYTTGVASFSDQINYNSGLLYHIIASYGLTDFVGRLIDNIEEVIPDVVRLCDAC